MTEYFPFLVIALALLGGWLSRMCGGGWPSIPFGLDTFLYAAPYLAVFLVHGGYENNSHILYGILSYAAAITGKRTGHGQYLGFAHSPRQPLKNAEKLDFIVTFFMGADVAPGFTPSYWRCAVGMAVTGLAETLIPGILISLVLSPLVGVLTALSGLLKPLGYMFGWRMFDDGYTEPEANVYGEIFNGFKTWGLLAWLLL